MPGGGLMLGWPRGTPLFCARAQGVLGLSPRERARRGGFTFWTYWISTRPSPPPLPTEPLPFLVTNVEHDGVLWVWGRTEASGDAQSGTVGTWRRIPGVTFH